MYFSIKLCQISSSVRVFFLNTFTEKVNTQGFHKIWEEYFPVALQRTVVVVSFQFTGNFLFTEALNFPFVHFQFFLSNLT